MRPFPKPIVTFNGMLSFIQRSIAHKLYVDSIRKQHIRSTFHIRRTSLPRIHQGE